MKNYKLKFSLIILVFLLFFHTYNISLADLGFNLSLSSGYYKIYPYDAPTENYTYFSLKPGLSLNLSGNRLIFNSFTNASLSGYSGESLSTLQNLNLSASSKYKFTDRTLFQIQDRLSFSGTLRSNEDLTEENLVYVIGARNYLNNMFTSNFDLRFKYNLSLSIGYNNTIRDYRDSEKYDWLLNSGSLRVSYLLKDKLTTQVGFIITRKAFDKHIDYINIPISISFKQKLGNRINASTSIGLYNVSYISSQVNYNRWSKPVLNFNVVGNITPKANLNLSIVRSAYDSESANSYSVVRTGGYLSLNMRLIKGFQTSFQGLFAKNNFIQINRSYNTIGGRCAVQYKFTRLGTLAVNYGYDRRISDISESYYRDHTAFLNYSVEF